MKDIIKKLVPKFLIDLYHQFWPLLGVLIYGFPARSIKVIGITGTNGKTTVVHLATETLQAAGYKVASISSLRFKIGEKEWKNELKMTMPGRMKMQKFLRQAVNARCQYVVMEVTSEGIKQHRHKFIDFDVAVFTNLTPEHIEAHGGFENYKKAKGELFKKAKISIVNLDDENAEYFLGLGAGEKWGYGVMKHETRNMKHEFKHVRAEDLKTLGEGSTFFVNNIEYRVGLLGKFNVYNALAAICVGLSQGVGMQVIKHALEKSQGIPGRMEVVAKEPFLVIVDYAHTPDALEKVYKTIKRENGPSTGSGSRAESRDKLICVLGAAGGGRDKWKRPQMGKIAAHYCDKIILTNEDPYDEDPQRIISQLESGVRSEMPCDICVVVGKSHDAEELGAPKEIFRILDRREAIKKALQIAESNDRVIITGKGAEPWLMTKEGRIPWDDREIVKEYLATL